MTSYSSNANVQNLVYGTTNTDWDAATTAARDAATSIINSHLERETDIDSPSDSVTRCCTLIAAGIISSSPDKLDSNAYYKQGLELLKSLKGDSVDDAEWGFNIITDGFGRHSDSEHDPTIPQL